MGTSAVRLFDYDALSDKKMYTNEEYGWLLMLNVYTEGRELQWDEKKLCHSVFFKSISLDILLAIFSQSKYNVMTIAKAQFMIIKGLNRRLLQCRNFKFYTFPKKLKFKTKNT